MTDRKTLDELYNLVPSMEAFLDNCFPILTNYVINTDTYSEQIIRLNIVIANIRHMLGLNYDPVFTKNITDVKTSKTMYELANSKSNVLLKVVLKCMVHILWQVTEDTLMSPPFIEGEYPSVDVDEIKKRIFENAVL
jgi:hypothetical protein